VQEGVEPAPRPQTVEDRWILSRLQRVVSATSERIEAFDLSKAAFGLYDFVYGELCDWYLELIKGRDFDVDLSATLLHVLRQTLALAHPIIPFVTEELWEHVPGTEGLLAADRFPQASAELVDAEAEAAVAAVIEAVTAVRSWRSDAGVRPGEVLPARLEVSGFGDAAPLVARLARLDLGGGEGVEPAASIAVSRGVIEILPSEAVDLEEAGRRREAERERLRGEIARAEGKLANDGFVAKAPPQLVDAERAKLERLRAELEAV
jgi:valyl-tRNA synthetase